jgi:hypothetical protein
MDLTQAAHKYTSFLNGKSLGRWISDHERTSDTDFSVATAESAAALHVAFAIKSSSISCLVAVPME